jgi:fatty-acyl-CoA synthase
MTAARPRRAVPLGVGTGVHPDRADWAPDGAAMPSPSRQTVGAELLDAALRDPHRVAYYLFDTQDVLTRLSIADVIGLAAGAAAMLRDAGAVRGDTVIIALDTGPDLLAAFVGCILLGAVPVITESAPANQRAAHWATRVRHLAETTGARHLILDEILDGDGPAEAARLCTGIRVLAARFPVLSGWSGGPTATPADLAFIQFTSGTTAKAKGIGVSHAALLANIAAMGRASGVREGDLMLGWLPLFHDMGLVGVALGPLLLGLPAALLSPLSFISRPERWLWAVHYLRGTMSPAPNFAYQHCLARVPDEALAGLDLSSWRLAFNGSEQVQALTIARWQERMGRYGFRATSMAPVYGLAEAALAVTAPELGSLPVVDRISRTELVRAGRAVPAPAGPDAIDFVASGRPLPAYQVMVVDHAGRGLGDREQGQILVTGPSVIKRYVGGLDGDPSPLPGGWLNTGDVGYLAYGQLFVTGRKKELLIKAGRNYHPHDIEAAVAGLAGVRGAIAVGIPDTAKGTDSIAMVIETPIRDQERLRALRRSVEDAVLRAAGIRPDTVLFVRPGALPRTTSGKLRRAEAAEMIAAGTLQAYPVTRPPASVASG